ncbi:MAG: nicotinate phosphoribosyltransferase, partial [Promethearchaeota archaeon]
RGFNNVKIFVSGGLGEKEVAELVNIVDGFGIGSTISAAPPIDFAMDLVEKKTENEWKLCAKRGKLSGRKQLWRCSRCFNFLVTSLNEVSTLCPSCKKPMKQVLEKIIEQGKRARPVRSPQEIRESLLAQLGQFKEFLHSLKS